VDAAGIFHRRVAPYASVLVNGMYWDARYPRLLTAEHMAALAALAPEGRPRLRAIADVACDLGGGLAFATRATTPDQPCYEWDAAARAESRGVGQSRSGVVVLAVDILPTALPLDASAHFGDHFLPLLLDLLLTQPGTRQHDTAAAAAAAETPGMPNVMVEEWGKEAKNAPPPSPCACRRRARRRTGPLRGRW